MNVQKVRLQVVKEEISGYSTQFSTSGAVVETAWRYINEFCSNDRENLILIGINTKHYVNMIHTISVGSINASISNPPEIFKPLLLTNCFGFVLVHNHPSGNPTPSPMDIEAAKRIKQLGEMMGILLLDNIILGDNDSYYSFKDKGIF